MDNAAFSPNSNSNEPTTPESRPNDVTPPFSESLKIRSEGQYTPPAGVNFPLELIRPSEDLPRYLACQLLTPKLNLIHHLLWLAGLPRAARPLHRQKLMQRAFILTESPDEHLVWSPGRIFIKPVPEYLLDHGFWVQNICPDRELHAAACGLLLSYAWLISELIDFQLAKDEHILPNDVTWEAWTKLIHELLQWIDDNHIDDSCNDDSPPTQNDPSHQPRPVIINKRYEFGELRLPRLNAIYRLTPTAFSFYNFVFGFMSVSTWYKELFGHNFSWLLTVLLFISVLLSAMQVGLATDALEENELFQRVCRVFAVTSILFPVGVLLIMLMMWIILFCYHFGFALGCHRRLHMERRRVYRRSV